MATIPTNYAGSDAGYAVIGIGATSTTNYDSYKFEFRRVGEKHKGRFAYFQSAFSRFLPLAKTKYYKSSDEDGVVEIAALQPGHYEVVNFLVRRYHGDLFSALLPDIFTSDQDFSIQFEIKPGEVVYLGNYQANRITERRGVFFILEDRFARDLALAKTRVASLPVENARNATPDVEKVGNRFLISPEQARIAK